MTNDEEASLTMPGELQAIHARLDVGTDRIKKIESVQAKMQAVQAEMHSVMLRNGDTMSEIRDIMAAARVGFKVLGGLGSAAKWLGTIAAAGVAIYAAFYALTHGGMPPK